MKYLPDYFQGEIREKPQNIDYKHNLISSIMIASLLNIQAKISISVHKIEIFWNNKHIFMIYFYVFDSDSRDAHENNGPF